MWQPIETAPKDGTSFLTYQPKGKESWEPFEMMAVMEYVGESLYPSWINGHEWECDLTKPTHWMSLPEAPK